MSLARARGHLGVTGEPVAGSLREALAAGPGPVPVLVHGLAAGALLAQGAVLLVAPAIALSLGRDVSLVGHLLGLWSLGMALAVPVAALGGARGRAASAAAGGAVVALALVVVAVAEQPLALGLAAMAAGAGTLVAAAGHRAELAARYASLGLAHVLAAYRAVALLTGCAGLLLTLPAVTSSHVSWRAGVLLLALLVGLLAPLPGLLPTTDDSAPRPGLPESMRRLMTVPSVRPLLLVVAVLAAAGFGAALYGGYALTERDGLPADTVPWVLVAAAVAAAFAVLDRSGPVAAAGRHAPRELAVQGAVAAVLAGAAFVMMGAAPWTPARLAALLVAVPALVVALLAVDRLLLLVVPAELHGSAGAMATTYAGVVGVGLGGALLSSLDASNGLAVALPVLGAAVAAAGLVLRAAGRAADADVEARAHALVERAEHLAREASGVRSPLLTCRGVNFSYGPLQILFDVDFTVDEGEMVALLGTNGAGKSTLLRVISGLGTPSSGVVRLAGQDVTHADPAERVRQGMTQIPGGKAVFGPLSVADNLRLYGYALGRDRKAVERGVEEAFATFPRLAERRSSPAATMSGGEQQMLALSKALLLQPRLLLIDELSLGLAPKVVGELLEMVRTINQRGTAVVLVEQSVNVALSLAEHAYFMEKGQVRFDGPTAELLERPDILRSVFLAGAGAHEAGS